MAKEPTPAPVAKKWITVRALQPCTVESGSGRHWWHDRNEVFEIREDHFNPLVFARYDPEADATPEKEPPPTTLPAQYGNPSIVAG